MHASHALTVFIIISFTHSPLFLLSTSLPFSIFLTCMYIHVYGSFHIRLTVDVVDLNEIIFFRFFINNRHIFFCLAKKIFLQLYDFSNFLRNDIFDIASALARLFILKTIVRTKMFPNLAPFEIFFFSWIQVF